MWIVLLGKVQTPHKHHWRMHQDNVSSFAIFAFARELHILTLDFEALNLVRLITS